MPAILPKGVSKQIARLNALTTGPAALKLPQNVVRMDLQFHSFVKESPSLGAKRFWRQYLSPIQFYNPDVAIAVRRYANVTEGRPQLVVEFEDGSKKTLSFDRKNQDQILEDLKELGAEPIAEKDQTKLGVSQY